MSGTGLMPDTGILSAHEPLFAEQLLIRERFYAGELFAFEEFEAGASAGGDVGDLIGYAGLVDG